jgi:hypothetical protein
MSNPCGGPCGCDATSAADADVQSSNVTGQWVSVYAVPKMDCPSEERMIRLALNGLDGIRKLTFDLSNRRVEVMHDGFADAAVYGLALYAVGRSVNLQVRAAHLAGVLQLILALGVLVEVVRRFVFGSEPESLIMMAVAFLALLANTGCLLLISMPARRMFSSVEFLVAKRLDRK